MAKVKQPGKIKVTLIRSTIGCLQFQKDNVAALGLKKIGQSKIHNNTPCIQGMIAKIPHMLKVEAVSEEN